MPSPFDQLGDSGSYGSSGKPRYRPQRRGPSGSFWIVGLVLLVVAIGGGVAAYALLWRTGAVPGSEYEAGIRAWCQKNLHDPEGFEIVKLGVPQYDKKTKETSVAARIRAKTTGGGKRLSTWIFEFKDGKVVAANEAPLGYEF